MIYRLSRNAERARNIYLYRVWADNPRAAMSEAQRFDVLLATFAATPVDGIEATIPGWPRPVRMHYIHPFKVYYARHPDALYVIRLHHHARRPIER